MNYQEEENLLNQMQDTIAEGISKILRSIDNKQNRMEALKRLPNEPTIGILKKVNEKALENEDYETCKTITDYCNEKGIAI